LDGVTTKAVIEVTDYAFENDYGVAVDGKASWNGQEYRLRLYLHEDVSLKPGDLVSGTYDFRITDKGGSREPTFHRGNGIRLLAYQSGDVEILRSDGNWWQYPVSHLRHEMLSLISTVFPDDTESFARGLMLGDDNDIGYELNTAFKISGVRHIIAVSGLHVSILFGLIYLLTARKRLLTTLVGVPLVVLFAALAGFTPSIVRASIMHVFMVLAVLFDREYDAPTAMGFAAVFILVQDPLAATSVGFQLSFGCVAGILLFYGPIRSYLLHKKRLGRYKKKPYIGGLIRGFASSIAVSLGAVSLTTPLCAVYFGTVSLISPLTNLLVLHHL
jgi:competence protein ComEC